MEGILPWKIEAQIIRRMLFEGHFREKEDDLRRDGANEEVPRLIPFMGNRKGVICWTFQGIYFAHHVGQQKQKHN